MVLSKISYILPDGPIIAKKEPGLAFPLTLFRIIFLYFIDLQSPFFSLILAETKIFSQ